MLNIGQRARTWVATFLFAWVVADARADVIKATLPAFDGPFFDELVMFPRPEIVVGTSAGVTLRLDGTIVATCAKAGPCYQDPAVDPWSSDFTAFDDLLDGSATLRAVQSSAFNIRLGPSQLVIKTVPAPAATSLLMMAASVVGFYRFRRSRRVRDQAGRGGV